MVKKTTALRNNQKLFRLKLTQNPIWLIKSSTTYVTYDDVSKINREIEFEIDEEMEIPNQRVREEEVDRSGGEVEERDDG